MTKKQLENIDHAHNNAAEIKISVNRILNRLPGIKSSFIANSARGEDKPHLIIHMNNKKEGVFFVGKDDKYIRRNTFMLSDKIMTDRAKGIKSITDNDNITKIAFVFELTKRRDVIFIDKYKILNAANDINNNGVIRKNASYGKAFQITNDWIKENSSDDWILPVPRKNNAEIYDL